MPSPATPQWMLDPSTFSNTLFDYIVVGGGTAGLALASRKDSLAEDSKIKVGVIEAGSYLPDDPMINVPANAMRMMLEKPHQWNLSTEPQRHAYDRSIYLPSGKALGGSSAVNFMAYMRASKVDYDLWEALGNQGWNWDGLLPYFKRSETFIPQNAKAFFPEGARPDEGMETQHRGDRGPLTVTFNETYEKSIHSTVKVANSLGIPTNYDPDSGTSLGIFNHGTTYQPRKPFRGLRYPSKTQASKIVFDHTRSEGDLLHATGVEFHSNGQYYTAKAMREVILSTGMCEKTSFVTGVFQTPQLLELSGIGNPKLLSSHGIKCLLDLPQVGENYQDHMAVFSSFELQSSSEHGEGLPEIDTGKTPATCSLFPLKNIVTEPELVQMLAKMDQEREPSTRSPLQKAQFALQRNLLDLETGTAEIMITEAPGEGGKNFLLLIPGMPHPYSRGSVHIKSKDPLSNPLIDPRFLEASFDLEVLSKTLQFCRKWATTEPLASLIVGPVQPDASVQSDEDYREFARRNVATVFHGIGTAAMAPRELGGVVDPNLRVYGTQNIRVVDASVIPMHIAGPTQASVYAIAEKAADIIKAAR